MDKLPMPKIGKGAETSNTPTSTSSGSTLPNVTLQPHRQMAAMRAVDRLFAWCPRPDVGDTKVFIAGAVAIFAEYPVEVVEAIADPVRGTRLLKPYPSLFDLRRACELLYEPIERELERRQAHEDFLRGLPPPRASRTPEQQAAIDAEVAAARHELGIPPEGLPPRGVQARALEPINPERVRAVLADCEARRRRHEEAA